MFNLNKNTTTLIAQLLVEKIFLPKRLSFFAAETGSNKPQEGAEKETEKPKTDPQEEEEILEQLQKQYEAEFLPHNWEKTMKNLATQVYPFNKERREKTITILASSMSEQMDGGKTWEKLREAKCKKLHIEGGKLTFINDKGETIKNIDLEEGRVQNIEVSETATEKAAKAEQAAQEARLSAYRTEGGTLSKIANRIDFTLKKQFPNAQEGDTVEVINKKGDIQVATFKKDNFYYENGKRAIILEGYNIGKYTKTEQTEINESAPENVQVIGSLQLAPNEKRPELKSYVAIAKTLLTKSKDELSALGIKIQDESLLKDLRDSKVDPFKYAKILQENQRGKTVFIIYAPEAGQDKLEKMAEKTTARRQKERVKYGTKEQEILNRNYAHLNDKDLFGLSGKEMVKLAEDEEDWNKIWDHEDLGKRFFGKEALVNLWKRMPPGNRTAEELRDLVRTFIKESADEGTLNLGEKTGANITLFFETFKVYKKEDGSTGSYEDFYQEYIEARKVFESNPPGSENNSYTQANRERYFTLQGILDGSILMMHGISKLSPVKVEKEKASNRAYTDGERRVHEFFDSKKDSGTTTSDLASESEKGKTAEFRLLPWLQNVPVLKVLASNLAVGAPKFFETYGGSEEAAWIHILDQNRNKDTGEIDNRALIDHLNKLLLTGIMGLLQNPEIEAEDLFEEFDINPEAPDRNTQLYNKLKFNSEEDLKTKLDTSSAEGKYKKALIQIGYVIDSRASEKTSEKSDTQKISLETMEKLSDNAVERNAQIQALKLGYPENEIQNIPTIIKNSPEIKNMLVAGALIDFGGPDRKGGAGGGVNIPLGHDVYLGLGVGKFNGQWQMLGGVGTGGKVSENLALGGGVGIQAPFKGEPGVNLGGGAEWTIPIENSTWDMFVDLGISTDLYKLVKGEANIGAGGLVGMKWNPDKALFEETQDKINEAGLAEIDEAMAKKDYQRGVELMVNHPTLGKLATILRLEYGDQAVVDFYQDQKAALHDAAAHDLNPIITRFGIGGGVGAGAKGVEFGVAGALAISVGKTVTVYRSQSRDSLDMIRSADGNLDRELITKAQEQFPGSEVKISKLKPIVEEAKIFRHSDGQLAIDATEQNIDLRSIKGEKGLSEYNAKLTGTGIKLEKSNEAETQGLVEIKLTSLEQKDDPSYNKRSTRIFIDPSLQDETAKAKGLIFKDGRIFLAANASPDLFFRRLDYYTPEKDLEGASAHTVICISDTPQRSIDDIMSVSQSYLNKKPNQPLEIRSNGPEQWNIQDFRAYQNQKERFESYEETDWSSYQAAMKDREKTYHNLSKENIRGGLVDDDLKVDCFAKRWYEKKGNSLLYKQLTTGNTADLKKLFDQIKKDVEKENEAPLNEAELNKVFLNLTRRSWASIENKSPAEKDKAFRARLEWGKKVLLPIWEEKAAKLDPPLKNKPADLLELAVRDLKDTDVNGTPEALPEGSLTTTLAGTEHVVGLRPNDGADALLGLDHYEQYLGQNSKQGEIARLILESESPMPKDAKEFMQSPLALNILSKRGLILAFGVEDFSKLTELYSLSKTNPEGFTAKLADGGYKKAFEKLQNLAKNIRAAQLDQSGGNLLKLDNGIYLQLRPTFIATGVDKSCANFTISINENFDLLVPPNENIVMGASDAQHSSMKATKLPAFFQIGVGAIGTIGPEKPKPTPPERVGETPPPPGRPTILRPIPKPAPGVNIRPGTGNGGSTSSQTGTVGEGGGGE